MESHGEVGTVLTSAMPHPWYIPAQQQQLPGSLQVPQERQTDSAPQLSWIEFWQ